MDLQSIIALPGVLLALAWPLSLLGIALGIGIGCIALKFKTFDTRGRVLLAMLVTGTTTFILVSINHSGQPQPDIFSGFEAMLRLCASALVGFLAGPLQWLIEKRVWLEGKPVQKVLGCQKQHD